MAVDPKARLQTLSYPGGRVTATLGLLEKLFGTQALTWVPVTVGSFTRPAHQRERVIGQGTKPVRSSQVSKKGYVGRMQSNNATGETATVYFKDGQNWDVRFAGPFGKLVAAVSSGSAKDDVLQVISERGAVANKGISIIKPA